MPRMRGIGKCSRPSTSGAPPPEELFLSPDHHDWYVSLLGRRVIQERLVESAPDLTNPIDSELRMRGWMSLCALGPILKVLTQEFYANAWDREPVEGPRQYRSVVRDKDIYYDSSALQRILRTHLDPSTRDCPYQAMLENMDLPAAELEELHIDPQEVFRRILETIAIPGTRWSMTQGHTPVPQRIKYIDLVPVAQFWYKFSVFIVRPSTHHCDVNIPRALLIYSIMTGIDVDICTLLADSLYATAHSRRPRAALGHSSLIQTLCLSAGVILPTDSETLRENTTIAVSEFLPRPPPVEGDDDEPADTAEAYRGIRGWGRRVHSSSQVRSLHRRMNLLMQRQDRLQQSMDLIIRHLAIPHPLPEPIPAPPPLEDEVVPDSEIDSSSKEF